MNTHKHTLVCVRAHMVEKWKNGKTRVFRNFNWMNTIRVFVCLCACVRLLCATYICNFHFGTSINVIVDNENTCECVSTKRRSFEYIKCIDRYVLARYYYYNEIDSAMQRHMTHKNKYSAKLGGTRASGKIDSAQRQQQHQHRWKWKQTYIDYSENSSSGNDNNSDKTTTMTTMTTAHNNNKNKRS